MEYKSSDIQNTKSQDKISLEVGQKDKKIKEKTKVFDKKTLIVIGISVITTAIICILMFLKTTNQVFNDFDNMDDIDEEDIDLDNDILKEDDFNKLDEIRQQVYGEEISENEGESQINDFFDQKLSILEDGDLNTKAYLLANKAAMLISVSQLEKASAIIQETSGYKDLTWDTQYDICNIGMRVAIEMEDDDAYAKYENECDKIYQEHIGADE